MHACLCVVASLDLCMLYIRKYTGRGAVTESWGVEVPARLLQLGVHTRQPCWAAETQSVSTLPLLHLSYFPDEMTEPLYIKTNIKPRSGSCLKVNLSVLVFRVWSHCRDDYFRMKLQWKSISADQEKRFSMIRDRKGLIGNTVCRMHICCEISCIHTQYNFVAKRNICIQLYDKFAFD